MNISMNSSLNKPIATKKALGNNSLLIAKLWKYNTIIDGYFAGKTPLSKLTPILKDPDLSENEITKICDGIVLWKRELIKIITSVGPVSAFLGALFETNKLSQEQVDSVIKKLYWERHLKDMFYNSYQLNVYKFCTPSVDVLTTWSRSNSINPQLESYFPYIRKNNWNSNFSFDQIKNFYKNQIINTSSEKVIATMSFAFPEAFEWLTKDEKKIIINNIYSATVATTNPLEKLNSLEFIFSNEDFNELATSEQKDSYKKRFDTIVYWPSNRKADSSSLFGKFLSSNEKKDLIEKYTSNELWISATIIWALVRGLTTDELNKNIELKKQVDSLISIWAAPIPNDVLLNSSPEDIKRLFTIISLNSNQYNFEKLIIKLKNLPKNANLDLIWSEIAKLALSGDTRNTNKELYLEYDSIKNNPAKINTILNGCQRNEKISYHTIFLYYLNGLDIDIIKARFPDFAIPNEIINVKNEDWIIWKTIDISSIDFTKTEFSEDEFKALLWITNKVNLASIFWENTLNWKKSLSNVVNYANFLIALRDNSELRIHLDWYKHPMNKVFIPNYDKFKKDILIALNWEKFSKVSKYSKLLYPIESLTIDINDPRSIIKFLNLTLTATENIANNKEYLNELFEKISFEDMLLYLWDWWNRVNVDIMNAFISKFVKQFWEINIPSKKIAIRKMIERINSLDNKNTSVSFLWEDWTLDWKLLIEIIKLCNSENNKTTIDLETFLNIKSSNSNASIKESIQYYIDNVIDNNNYAKFFSIKIKEKNRNENMFHLLNKLYVNNTLSNEQLIKVWKLVLDNSKDKFSKIANSIFSSTTEVIKKTYPEIPSGDNIATETDIGKIRLRELANHFKNIPNEYTDVIINDLLKIRELNRLDSVQKNYVKDFISIYVWWIKKIFEDENMKSNYWKDLSEKFEKAYSTKDLTDIKKTFEELNELDMEVFVDFFKGYIYPVLTKMNITSVQKAKYLWQLLNKRQFKAIIDSVK